MNTYLCACEVAQQWACYLPAAVRHAMATGEPPWASPEHNSAQHTHTNTNTYMRAHNSSTASTASVVVSPGTRGARGRGGLVGPSSWRWCARQPLGDESQAQHSTLPRNHTTHTHTHTHRIRPVPRSARGCAEKSEDEGAPSPLPPPHAPAGKLDFKSKQGSVYRCRGSLSLLGRAGAPVC